MMYLLDTHIILRLVLNPGKLSLLAKEILSNPKSKCFVSAVSFWEISIKYGLGKLALNKIIPSDFPNLCYEMGFKCIDITSQEASGYHELIANHHKDPFDRMLIWQAIQNNYTLITDDEMIKKYKANGLKTIG